MQRILQLFSLLLVCSVTSLHAQNRTIDGFGNNLNNPEWGAAKESLAYVTDNGYKDLVSEPGGTTRPNARYISNRLFAQDGLLNDPLHLSDFCWSFGQFIDHDITLVLDGREPDLISVPRGDTWFDPFNTGQVVIPMLRSAPFIGTGTSPANPRRHANDITSFIDGSAVYGSSEELANWLRSYEGGKLKMSKGNLLPFNTTTSEIDGPIDETLPHLDNATGISDRLFVAGDIRVNEQPLLIAFHTLFAREHNRLCDELALQHPEWNDEQIYQHARKIVGGTLAAIVYEEWLPAMGVYVPQYAGYNEDVNPSIFNVFSAAAFRLGHTLLNGNLMRMEEDGELMETVSLKDAFFNPMLVAEEGDITSFLRGMGAQVQQSLDAKVIDDVRNFLFGPPGAGGLDLAAINIQRGRERGLADFNAIRENFGLTKYRVFQEMHSDLNVAVDLQLIYGSINNIDPWVGMLAEEPMPGALFGETIMKIMTTQFTALRDGDRFYYENDPVLSEEEKSKIKSTRLHDVIMRNTDISIMQKDVFVAMSHEELCPKLTINGTIRTESGTPVDKVNLEYLDLSDALQSVSTDIDGSFSFAELARCGVSSITPIKNDDYTNGVSTLDLVFIQKHILGIEQLNTPYKLIAADVNDSKSITTLDMVELRKLILNVNENFPNNDSWRFIQADYAFSDSTNPFAEDFPETISASDLLDDTLIDFIAVKIGDVNNSATSSAGTLASERAIQPLTAETEIFDDFIEVALTAESFSTEGLQLALNYDNESMILKSVYSDVLTGFSEANYAIHEDKGLVAISWNDYQPVNINGDAIIRLEFTTKNVATPIKTSALLDLNINLSPETYVNEQVEYFTLETVTEQTTALTASNFPNPFHNSTTISVSLPQADDVNVMIYDALGKLLYSQSAYLTAGTHHLTVDRTELSTTSGVLYYTIESSTEKLTETMLLLK